MIQFTVYGSPATAGSKTAYPFRKPDGSLGVRVTHTDTRIRPWSAECKAAALEAAEGRVLLTGPVMLMVRAVRARPKGHYRTGRNANQIRDRAPSYPATKPDLTKIVRAVEDALTGVLWRDDSQVIRQVTAKDWGTPERVEITVIHWTDDDEDTASLGAVLGYRIMGTIFEDDE